MRPIAFLAKSRSLIRPKGAQCISTFGYLSQEAELAEAPPISPPLPSNPASGSPLYQENWRSPMLNSSLKGALIPAGFAFSQQNLPTSHFLYGANDAGSLINQFADLVTAKEWDKIILYFELWVKMLDQDGKPNRPDVSLYNHYLLANFMMGASAGDLLDLAAQMEAYGVYPNTASYNLVLRAMLKNGETVAAEKLLERMILSGKEQKESLPDDESYDIVIGMLIAKNEIDSALKYIDIFLKSGYALTTKTLLGCVRICADNDRLDTLVSILERCKKTGQDKLLCPPWRACNYIADVAIQSDNAALAFYALMFMNRLILRGEKSLPLSIYTIDEGLIVSALGTAGRTCNSRLLEASWEILKTSLRQKKVSNPSLYLGKICAYAKLGDLQKAFIALNDFEKAIMDSNPDADDEFLSPFFSLNPLVLACSKNGFRTLDYVYYRLENLSRSDDRPFKSVAALNCVILGCANIWDVDRAYQTFSAIDATFGLTPNIHSYNALICAFGKLGKRDEAVKVYEHFLGLGVKPNDITYALLVDAHLIKRDAKAALSVINEMVIEGHEPSREILKKIRRRCIREMDYESDDKVDSLAKTFKIRMGSESRRDILFNLKYTVDYA